MAAGARSKQYRVLGEVARNVILNLRAWLQKLRLKGKSPRLFEGQAGYASCSIATM
jgi:hypothetical protein